MNFLNKVVSKQIIYIPVIITIFFILLIITITTEKKVVMGKEYNDKYDVALYLKTYRDLPSNYFTVYGYETKSHAQKDITNMTIGGDTHWGEPEEREQMKVNSSVTLKECDIRGDNYKFTARGELRLVYTTNTDKVRVFYTEYHYDTITEISDFDIMPAHYIFLIITSLYSVISLACMVAIYVPYFINKKERLSKI